MATFSFVPCGTRYTVWNSFTNDCIVLGIDPATMMQKLSDELGLFVTPALSSQGAAIIPGIWPPGRLRDSVNRSLDTNK